MIITWFHQIVCANIKETWEAELLSSSRRYFILYAQSSQAGVSEWIVKSPAAKIVSGLVWAYSKGLLTKTLQQSLQKSRFLYWRDTNPVSLNGPTSQHPPVGHPRQAHSYQPSQILVRKKPKQSSEEAETKAQQPAIVALTNQRETTCRNTPFSVYSQQNLPNDD